MLHASFGCRMCYRSLISKAQARVDAMRAARSPCTGGREAAPEFGHFDSLASRGQAVVKAAQTF